LNSEAVSNVLNTLKAKAEFDSGERKNLYLRVATLPEETNTIYYDLANKDWWDSELYNVYPDDEPVVLLVCLIIVNRFFLY
jgi:hypothetical protein